VAKENMVTRARDELFSHINRCGVLQAEEDDQQHWMEETIDYLAERYPDLSDGDLQDLSSVGMRFCQPAIPHGRKRFGFDPREKAQEPQAASDPETPTEELVSQEEMVQQVELVPQEAGAENTLQES
jgi:hypothetical protein